MSASKPQPETRISEVPSSREITSLPSHSLMPSQGLPAAWLDRLLAASSSAPYEEGPERVFLTFVEAASDILPDHGLGLLWPPSPGPRRLVRRPVGSPDVASGRVFPEMGYERALPLAYPEGAQLHWAHPDPDVLLDDSPESRFLERLVQALGPALRLAIAHGSGEAQELRRLRNQVLQADKLAAVGRLAASAIHELNNPLTSIIAYADYLRRKVERVPLEPDDVDRLRRISEAAERIRSLTRTLVDYARPDHSPPGPLDLHQVIDQAASFCEHILADFHVAIEREYDGRAGVVIGVAGELTQVFVNLITNACQAMPRSGGRLVLRSELDGDMVTIHVHDNGHGIAPEHLPHIFDPFFTTKPIGSGTGLGLSIVRSIVQRHNGTIQANSDSGQGATFLLRLPCIPRG